MASTSVFSLSGLLQSALLLISRPKDLHVMRLMPGHNVGQRPDAHFRVVRCAAPEPRLVIQRAKKREICMAHLLKLVSQVTHRTAAEIPRADVIILLITGERRLVVASEAESAVGEDSLAVYQVPDQLLDAPLIGRVARVGLNFREAAQGRERLFELTA